MGKVVVIHSFRGGTGKTNTVANTAVCIASRGKRIGIVDTDIQSPGIHVLFGFEPDMIKHSLNDYLWNKCTINDAAYDVTEKFAELEEKAKVGKILRADVGKIFLIPSSMNLSEITKILKEGYEVSHLNEGLSDAIKKLSLDYLFIDTHPGIGEETLLSLAISDISLIMMRPDSQDYQGTRVTLEVCRRLGVSNLFLVINRVLASYDFEKVKADVEKTYQCPVAAVLPNSDDLTENASVGIFYLKHPEHPFSKGIEQIAYRVMSI